MAIEVRIPKEIKEYKEKIIFGLSFRQLMSLLFAIVICGLTYFLLKPLLGSNIASDVIIVEAIPIFSFGFIKVKGLNFETYAKIFIKHKLSRNKRVYEANTVLEYLRDDTKSVKEVRNIDFDKEKRETIEDGTNRRIEKTKTIRRRIKEAKKDFKRETKRRESKEINERKEEIQIARENYKKARKRKIK